MKKLIDFKDLQKCVQKYADKYHEGNFNLAVRQLVKLGMNAKPKLKNNEHDEI